MKIEKRPVTEDRVFIEGKDVTPEVREIAHLVYRLAFVYNKLDEKEFQELLEAVKVEAAEKSKDYSQAPNWIREWDGRKLER